MINNSHSFFRQSVFFLMSSLVLITSCSKRDVPYISDDAEIRKFIAESNLGKQFFRSDSLMTSDTFRVDGSPDTLYRLIFDSSARSVDVDISSNLRTFDFDFLGGQQFQDAAVKVDDTLYFRSVRIFGTDSTETASKTVFTRLGWFVKLGDDSHPYAGWLLYGFNGGTPFLNAGLKVRFDITAPMGYAVRGDTDSIPKIYYEYTEPNGAIKEDSIDEKYWIINDTTQLLKIRSNSNTNLDLFLQSVPSTTNYMIVTSEQVGGLKTLAMNYDSNYYAYTLPIPSNLPSAWYLMVFQELRNGTARRVWCVPYRIW